MTLLLPLKDETPEGPRGTEEAELGAERRRDPDPHMSTALGPSRTRLLLPVLPAALTVCSRCGYSIRTASHSLPRKAGEHSHTACAVPSGVKVPFKKTNES